MNHPKSFCHVYAELIQTADHLTGELRHMLDLGVVCDASVSLQQARDHGGPLRELIKRGGLVSLTIYPNMMDRNCVDSNWWKYSTEECERLLRIAKEHFEACGLGTFQSVTTYTIGNEFVQACRRLGITSILGFCAPTVGQDGGWEIAQYGAPLSPYFVSEEDFRKPENPGKRSDAVLVANMELRSPVTCLRFSNEGPWCPLNAHAVDRSLEPTDDPLQYETVAEDWIRLGELTGQPMFFNLHLQYFFTTQCYTVNRRAVEWLAEQRDGGRIETGGVNQWVKRMQPNRGFVPQESYWRGEMMGYHVGNRPGSVPDMVMQESLDRQIVWQYPAAVPWRYYDYNKPWHYPAYQPDGSAPASEDFSGWIVRTEPVEQGDLARQYKVTIANPGEKQSVVLALWDLLANCTGPFEVQTPGGWSAHVVPHPAGTSGVVLLEGQCPDGSTALPLTIAFNKQAPCKHRKHWGHLLEAQSFTHHHRPYTMLAAQTPEPFAVQVGVTHSGLTPVRYEKVCGLDYVAGSLPAAGITAAFDATRLACWYRFWDVTADQLVVEGVEDIESQLREKTSRLVAGHLPDLVVPEPGYQLFGDLTQTSRWERKAAQRLGEEELRRITAWFRQQRPDCGKVVVEAHPGIYMPRGSILCCLAHAMEMIRCNPGYRFRELCADYFQAWDWGVAAWVQWRHLSIRVEGLKREKGPYTLHFHAFDPEGRDNTQRIYLRHATDNNHETWGASKYDASWYLTPHMEWTLPQGLQGRWDPSALFSVRLPNECLKDGTIDILIRPLARVKMFSWFAEKGAPGLLSHFWVTCENA